MAESLYLASLEPSSGKSVVALGVMELLSRRLERVGYLRPVVPESEKADPRIDLIRERYDLGDLAVAVATDEEVQDRLAEGRRDDVFQRIVAAHKELHGRCDFVLIDGTDYTGVASALEFDFNAEVATHLGSPVLALVNGRDRSRVEIVDGVRVARESLATARWRRPSSIASSPIASSRSARPWISPSASTSRSSCCPRSPCSRCPPSPRWRTPSGRDSCEGRTPGCAGRSPPTRSPR